MGPCPVFGKGPRMTSSSRTPVLLAGIVLSMVMVMLSGSGEPGSAVTAPSPPLPAPSAGSVTTEAGLREAWGDPRRRRIDLGADIVLRNCRVGDPIRESPYPMAAATGTATRSGRAASRSGCCVRTAPATSTSATSRSPGADRDGPGAALTSRGEITLVRLRHRPEPRRGAGRRRVLHAARHGASLLHQRQPGQRRRWRRSTPAAVASQVYDSVLSNNLVDGSGGAIASTGDILVVRSTVDGNTTDGDGGALYADEDGDVTVIDSVDRRERRRRPRRARSSPWTAMSPSSAPPSTGTAPTTAGVPSRARPTCWWSTR